MHSDLYSWCSSPGPPGKERKKTLHGLTLPLSSIHQHFITLFWSTPPTLAQRTWHTSIFGPPVVWVVFLMHQMQIDQFSSQALLPWSHAVVIDVECGLALSRWNRQDPPLKKKKKKKEKNVLKAKPVIYCSKWCLQTSGMWHRLWELMHHPYHLAFESCADNKLDKPLFFSSGIGDTAGRSKLFNTVFLPCPANRDDTIWKFCAILWWEMLLLHYWHYHTIFRRAVNPFFYATF